MAAGGHVERHAQETIAAPGSSPARTVADVEPELVRHAPAVLYQCRTDEFWSGVEVTQAIRDLAGVTPARWMTDPGCWLQLVHPVDRPRLLRARIDAVSSGELDATYRIVRPDGETVWIHDEAHCRSGRVFGILRDVTKEQLTDEVMLSLQTSLVEEVERLRRDDAARTALVRTFVHDIRGSLRQAKAIVGSQHADAPDGPGRERLSEVLGDLYALVNGLLDVGELCPTEAVVRTKPVRLGPLVDAAILEAGARGRVVTCEDNVGEAVLDPVLVARILVNLIGNAVRHTPPGTTVRIQTFRTGDSIGFAVEDDGPGMSESDRRGLFEPFVDLGEDPPQWGVGLSLVERLVALHGGRIWVDDVPGGGAAFNVVFPQPAATVEPAERGQRRSDVPDRCGTAVPVQNRRSAGRSGARQR